MFGLSHIVAQSPQHSSTHISLDLSRLQITLLVVSFYFGLAAHYWYNFMFRILPESTVRSNLLKMALVQVIFGSVFVIAFGGVTLLEPLVFFWVRVLGKDLSRLAQCTVAGFGFCPFMSYLSYA